MRTLLQLAASLLLAFVLILLVIGAFPGDIGWSLAFFIFCLWPMIWFIMVVYSIDKDERGSVDMRKMQNYYNLAAIRQNTNRIK